MPTRRTVLTGALGVGALASLSPALWAAPRAPGFRISLAEWSLHRMLQSGELDNLEFPRYAKEIVGVDAVEYVNSFFKDSKHDFDYLRELRQRCDDVGVRSLLIMVDGEGNLAAEDEAERDDAVERHYPWIVAAAYLGCHSIRVNAAGGGGWMGQAKNAAHSLHRLADMGAGYGVSVIVENHGGLSSNGEWLAQVMELARHEGVGTLPDFGNFHLGDGEWYDRYQGVRELMPYAKAVSAKSHDFDDSGNETHTDYRRMLGIVAEAGYDGYIGIEYEGGGLDELDGVLATKALLERVRAELAGG